MINDLSYYTPILANEIGNAIAQRKVHRLKSQLLVRR